MSGFDFGLQFLDPGKMTYWGNRYDADFWTENASLKWNESEAPFHTVGRLTLLANSHLRDAAADAVYFDVTRHSTPEARQSAASIAPAGRAKPPAEKRACQLTKRPAKLSANRHEVPDVTAVRAFKEEVMMKQVYTWLVGLAVFSIVIAALVLLRPMESRLSLRSNIRSWIRSRTKSS